MLHGILLFGVSGDGTPAQLQDLVDVLIPVVIAVSVLAFIAGAMMWAMGGFDGDLDASRRGASTMRRAAGSTALSAAAAAIIAWLT